MTSFEIILILASWGGALPAVLRRSIRARRSLLPTGMAFWAVGCTLFCPTVYDWIDPLLGGVNLTNLLWRSFVIIGIGYLAGMVLRATRDEMGDPRAERIIATATGVTLLMQLSIFLSNKWATVDTYLLDYGGTLGREAFVGVMATWMILFSIYLLIVLRKAWRGHSVRSTRWGLGLIGLSVIFDAAYGAYVVATGVIRVTANPTFLLGNGLDAISVVTLLCGSILGGLGVALACFPNLVNDLRARWLLLRVLPLWQQARGVAPSMVLANTTRSYTALIGPDVEIVLCRRWVELLDFERVGAFCPQPHEQRLLAAIAEQLSGPRQSNHRNPIDGFSSLLNVGNPA